MTTTTISSVESTVTSKVYKVNPKTTELPLAVKNVTSKTASDKMQRPLTSSQVEVKKSSEDPHRAPKSIVHPRNPDNRLLLLDRPFHLSATTTQPVIHTSTLTDTQWAILQFCSLQLVTVETNKQG